MFGTGNKGLSYNNKLALLSSSSHLHRAEQKTFGSIKIAHFVAIRWEIT